MADAAAVRGTPPALLRRTFELTARGLRMMGRGRYVIGDVAGTIAYAVQPPRKRRIAAHLHSRAAGGLDDAEAKRRARASYRSYSRMIIDTIWIHAIPVEQVLEHGWLEDRHHLDDAAAAGRGVILVLVHFGSWDAGASFSLAAGYPVTSVMAPVGPQWVTDLIAWSRKAKRMELFTPEAAARGLIRALRANKVVALLVDIPEGGPTVTVPFRNGPVRFSVGPAFLARLTGATIVPVDCWREPSGYCVRFHAPLTTERGEDDQSVMTRIAAVLEQQVRRTPEQWYPFNPIYTDEDTAAHARPASDGVRRPRLPAA